MRVKHPALVLGRASLLFCSERCRRFGREDLARHGSPDWIDTKLPTGRARDMRGRPWGTPSCFTCGDSFAQLAGSPPAGEGTPAATGPGCSPQEGAPLGEVLTGGVR